MDKDVQFVKTNGMFMTKSKINVLVVVHYSHSAEDVCSTMENFSVLNA